MGLFNTLGIGADTASIDWELRPEDTFGMFESWGGKERIRHKSERFYYFFIDAWEQPAKLCLMERGIKYAQILAEIKAPQPLIDACIAHQGKTVSIDKHYAIDAALRAWLETHVVESDDDQLVILLPQKGKEEVKATGLPGCDATPPALSRVTLRSEPAAISDDQIEAHVRQHNFFDSRLQPTGRFASYLTDNHDGLTVTDLVTGLTWQRGGHDIATIRHMQSYAEEMHKQKLAGLDGWRLPTVEELLSLLLPTPTAQGLFIHSCFSAEQPFVFSADLRRPGGNWFMDFKQGTVFWASGFNPGGFGRLCRSNPH